IPRVRGDTQRGHGSAPAASRAAQAKAHDGPLCGQTELRGRRSGGRAEIAAQRGERLRRFEAARVPGLPGGDQRYRTATACSRKKAKTIHHGRAGDTNISRGVPDAGAGAGFAIPLPQEEGWSIGGPAREAAPVERPRGLPAVWVLIRIGRCGESSAAQGHAGSKAATVQRGGLDVTTKFTTE